MTYPNVALRLHDYLPTVELQPAEGEMKPMLAADRGLDKVLVAAAATLGADMTMSAIMALVATGDEYFLEFPEIDLEQEDIDFKPIEKIVAEENEAYTDMPGVAPEVAAEIKHNWRADVLASMLNEIYNLLIARTVLSASDVGVGAIQLIDNNHDARLREKMARDLASIELELLVSDPAGDETE